MEHRESFVSLYSIYGVHRRNNWVTMFVDVSNMNICMHLDDKMTFRLLLSKIDPRGEFFSRVLCMSFDLSLTFAIRPAVVSPTRRFSVLWVISLPG